MKEPEKMTLENTEVILPSNEISILEQKLTEEIDFPKLTELCRLLCDDIKDIFNSCGLYFRIFSRIKSPNSIAKKLQRGKYGTPENPKKIQDLIGLRIIFYYFDDISIGREIMEATFQLLGDWARDRFKANEFQATKINGVFRFPAEYLKLYKKTLWTFPIDTTFELQFRTVFFEGWHEIEHDMRYKSMLSEQEFWKGSLELSRVLNCILANLELSDWSLVKLFDELSYHHFNHGNWDLMLKSKFRIHLNNEESLAPEIITLLNEDPALATQFFKAQRRTLIMELLRNQHAQINYNLIIKLLNEKEIKNPKITEFFNHPDSSMHNGKHPHPGLVRLENDILFHMKLPLLHKETRLLETEFSNAASILYKWARYKFNPVFGDLPLEPSSYQGKLPGYQVEIAFEPEHFFFSLKLDHIDLQTPGTLWHAHAYIRQDENGELSFYHVTSIDMPRGVSRRITFKRPSYLTDLSNKIGLVDVVRLGSKAKIVNDDDALDELIGLIRNPKRQLPVIVITQNQPETAFDFSETDDWEYDMNTFTINGTRLAKVIGLYCHVYMTDYIWNQAFADELHLNDKDIHGCIAIFWSEYQQRQPEIFTKEMVKNAQFDFNRFAFHKENIGEKAFRHKLVQIIKDDHVTH